MKWNYYYFITTGSTIGRVIAGAVVGLVVVTGAAAAIVLTGGAAAPAIMALGGWVGAGVFTAGSLAIYAGFGVAALGVAGVGYADRPTPHQRGRHNNA